MMHHTDTTGYCTPYPEAVSRMAMYHRQINGSTWLDGHIWYLQHTPMITRGVLASDSEVFAPSNVPVYRTERGGKATYHGPGQLVIYPIVRIASLGFGVRQWVDFLLETTTRALSHYGCPVRKDCDNIGVYTDKGKIASLGIRLRKGISMHGVAINIDLQPNGFQWIDPCGVKGGTAVDAAAYNHSVTVQSMKTTWWQTALELL